MPVIIDRQTKVLVQGMTGKEGQRAAQSMIESGIFVSAGVTPGKGGVKVIDRPIFDSVQEAMSFDPTINTTVLYVPPLMVLDAAAEAIYSGIKTIVIVTENVPITDSAKILNLARQNKARVIGPASVGILNTRLGKVGSIADIKESPMYSIGSVGIISKSGGMCSETAGVLTQAGLGQSTVIGIGGDKIVGSDFVDLLPLFEQDPETEAVVIFGEIGGYYENKIVEAIKNKIISKPIIAFIAGLFAENIKRDLALGHAGAIIEGQLTSSQAKKEILKKAGVLVAEFHYEIPELVKQALKK